MNTPTVRIFCLYTPILKGSLRVFLDMTDVEEIGSYVYITKIY